MAARDGEVSYDQLHHFIASGVWDAAPLDTALLTEADRMVGGADAWLIVDDTALPKKGEHSVGVAPQYASSLGKTANCQSLVSLTLASREVPVMVGLRLFLPESWTEKVGFSDRSQFRWPNTSLDENYSRTQLRDDVALVDSLCALRAQLALILRVAAQMRICGEAKQE